MEGQIEKSLDIDTKAGTVVEGEVETKKKHNSIADIMIALSAAVDSEQITSQQARQLRANLGIRESYFTKKQTDPATRNKKRKAQKAARKKNRGK